MLSVTSKTILLALTMLSCSVLFVNVLATSSPNPIMIIEPRLQDVTGGGFEPKAGEKLVIATNAKHNFGEQDYDTIILFEARDSHGVTQFLAWHILKLEVAVETQVAVSWVPERAGTYDLRAFALTNDWDNPQVMSGIATSQVTIAPALCTGSAKCFVGTVTHIVDGDTLDVEGKRIRLALVNTPEIGENRYADAKKFAEELCPVTSDVTVDQDDGQLFDVYGRMVAKVTCGNDNKILNAELLYYDYAEILTEYCDESEFSSEFWAQRYGCRLVSFPTPIEPQSDDGTCDPSYPDVCIPSPPPDLDCSEIAFRNFKVLQPDPHRFDNDKNGIGCEST